jgi:3-phosphoshikimate 1-carboxyvinyltransferase
VRGVVHAPGDKSVTQRAIILALLSTEPVTLSGIPLGRDVATGLDVIAQLGARIERSEDDPTTVTITGVGLDGVHSGSEPINCGNSGTLARLLTGVLAGQPAGRVFELIGDESLSARPMDRVADPLRALGADIQTAAGGTLPMTITSSGPLQGGEVELAVPSAQVQSALMLAALTASKPLMLHEPTVLRDHTERLLRRSGVPVKRVGRTVTIEPVQQLQLPDTRIAADPSSAAPWITAATLLHGSVLHLPGVIESPGRSGFVDVLEQMGARVGTTGKRELDGEPIADYEAVHASVTRTFVEVEDVSRMIDELPLLALVAHFRRGEFVVRGAAELRHKESDRIEQLALAMRRIGVSLQPLGDGFIVRGSSVRPDGGTMESGGDHRMAILGGIAGLVSRNGVTIEGADCVAVSYPDFFEVIDAIAVR